MTGVGSSITRGRDVGTLSLATGIIVGAMSMEGAHLKMCPGWAAPSILGLHRQLCNRDPSLLTSVCSCNAVGKVDGGRELPYTTCLGEEGPICIGGREKDVAGGG
uniref:Uncharacterized protein n=1 Tax=Romanomermis culicivorax TaxID=13658 RepID=A0A915INB4_ROMCU